MGKVLKIFLILLILQFFVFPEKATAASLLDVVINEVAWSGTAAQSTDEWIELYNNTGETIDLSGWHLLAADGSPNIALSGTIPTNGYFLLERTDDNTIDNTISDIPADLFFSGLLYDTGESLALTDHLSNTVDTVNADGGPWPAGTDGNGTPLRASMERINPLDVDVDSNWGTNDGIKRNGLDANGNPVNSTPKSQNSQFPPFQLTATPTPEPTIVPTFTPTPTETLRLSHLLSRLFSHCRIINSPFCQR